MVAVVLMELRLLVLLVGLGMVVVLVLVSSQISALACYRASSLSPWEPVLWPLWLTQRRTSDRHPREISSLAPSAWCLGQGTVPEGKVRAGGGWWGGVDIISTACPLPSDSAKSLWGMLPP